MLEPNNGIIRVADDDDVALRILPPLVCPLIEYVVQVDVRKQWADDSPNAKDNFEFERRVRFLRKSRTD